MKKVKHNDCFYIINNEGFFHKNSDLVIKETGETDKYIQYQWVIPMYVYSINSLYDGTENFDLCPVDCTLLKNNKNSWKWRRSFEYETIGKEIFYTEKEAWDHFNNRYNDDQKKVFEELRRLRFLQEKSVTLI